MGTSDRYIVGTIFFASGAAAYLGLPSLYFFNMASIYLFCGAGLVLIGSAILRKKRHRHGTR